LVARPIFLHRAFGVVNGACDFIFYAVCHRSNPLSNGNRREPARAEVPARDRTYATRQKQELVTGFAGAVLAWAAATPRPNAIKPASKYLRTMYLRFLQKHIDSQFAKTRQTPGFWKWGFNEITRQKFTSLLMGFLLSRHFPLLLSVFPLTRNT
jgi:hypothetical protein